MLADCFSWIIIIPPLLIKNLIFPYFSTHFINHIQEHWKTELLFFFERLIWTINEIRRAPAPSCLTGGGTCSHMQTVGLWNLRRSVFGEDAKRDTNASCENDHVRHCVWMYVSQRSVSRQLSPWASPLHELGHLMCVFIYEAEKRGPGFTLNSAKALACLWIQQPVKRWSSRPAQWASEE